MINVLKSYLLRTLSRSRPLATNCLPRVTFIISHNLTKSVFRHTITSDKSHYENVPFEIPESWCWTTLGELFDIVSAKRVLQSDWQRTGIPFYRAREIVRLSYEGYVDNDLFITEEHYNNLKKSYGVPEPSDIMLSAVGTIGRAYVVRNNDVFYYKDASVLCLRNVYHLNPEFIKWILSSDLLQNQMYENSKGTTVDTITIEKANSYFLPLPPIDEQYRIVKLLCEWDAYINDINKNKEEVLNNIRTCKSKILDLAISGKLVPQDPNDEPAIELLRRINPAFKPCDNSHYENLPQGWAVCRLEDLLDYEQPQAYIVNSTDYSDEYETPVLTAGKSFIIGYTNETNGICDRLPVIIFDDFTTDSKLVDFPFKVKSSAMKILRTKGEINIDYIAYYMSITRLIGNTHKRYWISEYSKLLIPIPPYQEQLRIVETIEIIFDKIHNITAELS